MPVTSFRIPLFDVYDFLNEVNGWSASVHIDASPMIADREISETDSSVLPFFAFVDDRFFEQHPRWREFQRR
ncbi:hypothetical protein SB394_02970 [Burkholderia sp. BCCIQ04A]|uniref:Uncharacterized protein n=1 Tax=Burkholderia anthinoferrum TaxID=3090833 RepID=A0ABU5WVR4_9BURK|nr:hypothetical protein [Burkholderia anthinoferrum]MEB2535929.1 hypothetical protein [Burkholderia anthinoferrum]MEB2562057.1 hypothetical protein [Burkholderia anthinoferrum]MEB2582357.1 hypothetical protein [Burkholderia anthinoferrum]MEB2632683.1 hypothetical protein [Burkholderia anthinoferrum]